MLRKKNPSYSCLIVAGLGCTALWVSSLTGCEGEACVATYPSPPADAAAVVHVAPCGGPGADGSAEHPYATLSEGLDAVRPTPGAAILVASGTYAENLVINSKVTILGPGDPGSPDDAAIILQAPDPTAVRVEGKSEVTLSGVRIPSGVGVGVWVRDGSSLTLSGSVIRDIAADAKGIGYGVLATEDSAIILQHTEVSKAAVIGVLISEARGIILQSDLHDNGGPGLRVESATDEIHVEGTQMVANVQSGMAILNSRAIILQSTMSGTLPDPDGIADGLLAAGLPGVDSVALPTEITISDSTLCQNGRSGVLASGAVTRTIILQNNTICSNSGTAPMGAGVWLQGGAGSAPESVIEGNTLSQNRFLGMCMRGETQGIILQNNQITGTVLGTAFSGADSIQLGDGIHLLDGASAQVLNNQLEGNERLGLLLDNVLGAQTVVQNNTFDSNGEYGAAVQNTQNAPSMATNTYQNNTLGDLAASPSYSVPAKDLDSK